MSFTVLRNSYLLLSIGAFVLFVAVAIAFSFHQNLWVDETTQLSGLSLPLTDIYLWLSGLIENPFPVPADRMPFLSYLVGYLWSYAFGLDVLSMRWLSLVLVSAALITLMIYFFRRQQYVVMVVTLLFLCLSPNLVITAVEIRAYSLFFFFSVIALVLYLDIIACLENDKKIDQKIIVLLLVLTLAVNTHFFGLVLTGAILGSYIVVSFFDPRFVLKRQYIFSACVVLGLGVALIILPVVGSFTSQDGSKSSTSMIAPAIKLIYRLVAHQSISSFSIVPYIVLVVFYGVIAVSLFKRFTLVKVVLALMLLLGFSAVFIANVALANFDALAPHYNIWMLPVIAVLFGYSVADLNIPIVRWLVISLVMIWGSGQYVLAFSGAKYAHTRFDQIEKRVDQYRGQGQVGIVYNKPMAKTWFAGRYYFDVQTNQYIATTGGYSNLKDDQPLTQDVIESENDILIIVYGEDIYSNELVALPANRGLPANSPVHHQITLPDDLWTAVDSGAYIAQESADIIVYKKTP